MRHDARSGDKMPDKIIAGLREEIQHLQSRLFAIEAQREKETTDVHAARMHNSLFEAMLDIIPVGVVLSDATGKIILGNSVVEKMVRHPVLNSDGPEAYGEWISYHPDGSRVESSEYPLAKVIAGGADYAEIDVNYQRGDGSKFWMRIIAKPVIDPQNERIGAVVALVDVDREAQLAEQQKILIGELNHRVKNAFSVAKSIVSMSMRKEGLPKEMRETIEQRLDAYARAHSKLVGSEWEHAPLVQIVDDIAINIGGERIKFSGDDVNLSSRDALALSMALYELSTNAMKYGALSEERGQVEIKSELSSVGGERILQLKWIERNGPLVVVPEETGFGSFIVDTALAMETGGEVAMKFEPAGFEWHFQLRLN